MSEVLFPMWKNYYHNSKKREGILSWYNFKKEGRILEWYPQKGALTEMLSLNCRELVCIKYYEEDANVIKERCKELERVKYLFKDEIMGKFDYIVAVDAFKYYLDAEEIDKIYSEWKDLLSKKGTLLLVINNIYSILNAIGINNSSGRKDDIVSLKKNLGKYFKYIKLYYVYPDYIFPQEIYTDADRPTKKIATSVLPYAANIDDLREYSWDTYKKSFEIFEPEMLAGSYLIECNNNSINDLSDVERVKITSDRGKNSIITILTKNSVIKDSYYCCNNNCIKNLSTNLSALKERGVNVVRHEYRNGRLIMPRLKTKLLIDILQSYDVENKEGFIDIFKDFFRNIACSSEISKDRSYWNNKYGYHDWGLILKEGYIEMTPLNCFYDGNEFIFFDQEYVQKNCSIKYIMYRCLVHTYMDQNVNYPCSFEDMIRLFGLDDLCEFFEKEERSFMTKIHEFDDEKIFHKLFSISEQYTEIYQNPKMSLQLIKYLFNNIGDKRIVCLGVGNKLDMFLELYSSFCEIDFIAIADDIKTGSEIKGYAIKGINEINSEKHRVIITGQNAIELEKVLLKHNITDYRYIYHFDWE